MRDWILTDSIVGRHFLRKILQLIKSGKNNRPKICLKFFFNSQRQKQLNIYQTETNLEPEF